MSSSVSSVPRKVSRSKLTLSALSEELRQLRVRVEDLEDLRELNEAIGRNRGKQLIPWAAARKELGLAD